MLFLDRFIVDEFDAESSHSYYRARYYDPSVGRLLSEDPVGFRGRDINLYRYVRNHPSLYTDPIGLITIDPTFNSNCLPSLKRALGIVRRLPKQCNCAITKIGSHLSLNQLLDDPSITVHYDAGPPQVEGEDGYTLPGDTHNIWIHGFACRMGRFSLAAILVHELAHISLVPGPGQEDQAYGIERACGLSPLSTVEQVGSAPFPPPEPSSYSAPNKLVEP